MKYVPKFVSRARTRAKYALWRLRTQLHSREAARKCQYDVNTTYWIDPARIVLALDSVAPNRLDPNTRLPVPPLGERGKIVGGDWDVEETIRFEDMDVWRGFQQHFAHGAPWEKTSFYERVMTEIRGGIPRWGCPSKEDFDRRLLEKDRMFSEIRRHGYRQQKEIATEGARVYGDEDEVQVHIGRDGDYIFANGRHRLCIAKLLKLDRIPVKVARRHAQWAAFRQEILAFAARQKHRKIYAPILHPDLADIPSSHGTERFEMIRDHLPAAPAAVLDIGSHWGHFCHCLEGMGYRCTAVESAKEGLYFLRKLRRAENRQFEVIDGSILDLETDREFDVVLALNIFHHFLKTKDLHEGMVRLLGRLKMRVIFFQPHLPEETQMAGAFRNYSPGEFVSFVKEHGRFSRVKELGAAAGGRAIFKLER